MYILGISCYYHDSSATLLKDGKVVFATEEERFTRVKHDFSFPMNSIEHCLRSENISIEDVDQIAYYEKPLLKFERVLYQVIEFFPRSFPIFLSSMPSWFTKKLRVMKIVRKKLGYKKDVVFVPHHSAHAASTFFASSFKEAAIVTIDGVGEWATTTIASGEDNRIDSKKEIKFPHSIGLLYSTVTAFLGFSVNNSEYKVMGLSAYGNWDKKTNPYYEKLLKLIDIKTDGSFRLDMKYFSYCYKEKMYSNDFCTLLGEKPRPKESEIEQKHKDIAAALQMVTEKAVFKILKHARSLVDSENLTLSGGVALNSVINGKILEQTGYKDLWIQPAAGDGGTSMGAALFVHNQINNGKRKYLLEDCYLGPGFDNEQIEKVIKDTGMQYSRFASQEELVTRTAELIYENKVVSWFQGRMEWGPRALGSRSILANPLNPKMKDILNLKVKHREAFRPFAPVVCVDDVARYFECDKKVPIPAEYMLQVVRAREEVREKIPSVVHINGTSRIQAVVCEKNLLYYDLIKKFGEISGIPILINTSFNVRGEPIVCTPRDALNCFMGTGIDYLIIGDFIIKKEEA